MFQQGQERHFLTTCNCFFFSGGGAFLKFVFFCFVICFLCLFWGGGVVVWVLEGLEWGGAGRATAHLTLPFLVFFCGYFCFFSFRETRKVIFLQLYRVLVFFSQNPFIQMLLFWAHPSSSSSSSSSSHIHFQSFIFSLLLIISLSSLFIFLYLSFFCCFLLSCFLFFFVCFFFFTSLFPIPFLNHPLSETHVAFNVWLFCCCFLAFTSCCFWKPLLCPSLRSRLNTWSAFILPCFIVPNDPGNV